MNSQDTQGRIADIIAPKKTAVKRRKKLRKHLFSLKLGSNEYTKYMIRRARLWRAWKQASAGA